MTHWQQWHEPYDDPTSALSARLRAVQQQIVEWADAAPAGPLRVLSVCAGQGRDVVGALAGHGRRGDVTGRLVELDAGNVEAANDALAAAGLDGVRAVLGDAGSTSSYAGAVPADLVLVCGVFGNIPDADVFTTIDALPMLCAADATVIWTRHRGAPDLTPAVRTRFAGAGFEELSFLSPGPESWAVGTHHLVVSPKEYEEGVRLFTFR